MTTQSWVIYVEESLCPSAHHFFRCSLRGKLLSVTQNIIRRVLSYHFAESKGKILISQAIEVQYDYSSDNSMTLLTRMPLNLVGASFSHAQWPTPIKCQSVILPTCHLHLACQRSRVPYTPDENVGSSFPLPLLLQKYSSTTCLDLDHLLAQVLDACVWGPV